MTKTWTPIQTVRAEKVVQTVAEELAGFGNAAAGDITLRIRFLDDLKTADRITLDGADYDLEQITELGRRHGQELRGVLVQ
ncbi:head-tail adaptor protein [Tateyamaria sp. SN3-11]|uniref:phage head completion protein n=1 Tax=Tateyamaria sp. SN3-11 TaxID=3092147 RepID=UPI0039E7A0D8